MTLAIFLPVYNEEQNLEINLKKIIKFLKNKKIRAKIIFINDCSNDNSEKILFILKKKYKINYVTYSKGKSRRENLALTMNKTNADYLFFMDFDLATNLKHIPELLTILKKDADIVTGSRYLKKSKLKRETHRLIISKTYNWFMRFLFDSKIKDHQCGFKGFRKTVFKEIYQDAGYDETFKRGWFWDVEMLVRAQKKGYKVLELPVEWVAGKKTTFNIKQELKMIPHIFKLRLKL